MHARGQVWSRALRPLDAAATRLLDLTIAGVGLVVTAPLLAILMLAIRAESRGDPIYRQQRVGRNGVPFEMWKLRTMVDGAEHMGAGHFLQAGDARITKVGAFLRRTSLDELPNLVNVLRGEMSIVGPRPTVQWQVDRYTDHQRRRLEVRPGITGWAQVNGRAALPWDERIELDVWYVEHRSVLLDLRILARTIGVVLHGGGLYKGATGGWRDPVEPAKQTGASPSGSGAAPAEAPEHGEAR
jgi:lipopolysaccharide/colanic/teichoic acid biosynthesis glycosyltransferase